ncbi:unnamed protein product [Symbiodinium pilosum]|uniref:Uncharacterized protein n=1 Tax=Symbiodinium pilosum TaxID=2952 RepID=A0A812X1T2_SYMPI|nr:unnamed protein product [Symbiodinium pilosum]
MADVDKEDRWQLIREYMAGYFFETRHFQAVAACLSSCGDKRHVIAAAARLLSGFGVEMSLDDQQELMAMDEEEQINALLAKIPQDGDGQFQEFFGQLQQLVVCSGKVRSGLETGDVLTVEEALADAVSFNIAHVVYRMAATQAGAELRAFRARLKEWGKDNAAKTGKLTRCQEEAMGARKKLAAAQFKLGRGRDAALQKSSRFVLHFAEGSMRGLGTVVFRSWQAAAAELRSERRVAMEFEKRRNDWKQRMQEFKERQLRGVRGLSERQVIARQREAGLDCFWAWQGVVRDRKLEEDLAKKLEAFRVRLGRMKQSQVLNADSFLLKASTYSEAALLSSCFQAFVAARREVAEEAACKAQLQKTRDQIDLFRKSKSATAKRILREMCCCTEAGLAAEAWAAWAMLANQARDERAIRQQLDESAQHRDLIRRRSKESGHKVAEKLRGRRDVASLVEALVAWRLLSRVEGKTRHHRVRVDAKRQQLQGVQTMFRSFATQLEYQLAQSQQSHKESRLYKLA